MSDNKKTRIEMNKTKKKALCLLLSLFAAANAFVAVSTEKQKSLFSIQDAEAMPGWGDLASFINWIETLTENDNAIVYKYNTRQGLSCAPIQIFSGKYEYGSNESQNLDAHLGLTGNASYATGGVSGDVNANYQARKDVAESYKYEYSVYIWLGGNDWKVKTCEPCHKNDPNKIGKNCKTYDECAAVIESRSETYRQALGLS